METVFDIIPFEDISFLKNKFDNKAKTKYGLSVIIGLHLFGKYLMYSSLIKHALDFVFFKSSIYFTLEKKINHHNLH